MVETDLVEGVLQGQATLDLMGLDHSFQHISDGQDLTVAHFPSSAVGARDPVCYRENGTQVVRWVTPLGCQPAVVIVEPSNHGTDVECSIYGIQLIWCTWDLCSIGNHGAFNCGAEDSCALWEA